VSLAKKEIDLDSLSLEGLEDLLDQIFGKDVLEPVGAEVSPMANRERASAGSDAHSGEPARLCATLTDTRVARHKRLGDNGEAKQVQVLGNQIKILRARLHFALEQLEQARLTESSLRLSLAHVQDELKELSQKSEAGSLSPQS
jgi:hypothetical protein